MDIPINFVTTDFSRWGSGLNRLLDPPEIDRNFWELARAVADLIANPPEPIQIASFNTSGGVGMTITMSNGSVAGPLALPVLTWRWRDAWLPSVPYATLDVFRVDEVGIFLALQDHTAAATFDSNAILSGNPIYQQLFGVSKDSVETGIAAAGSNQSGAAELSARQNYVSSAIDGTKGVRISASLMVPGTHIHVANEDSSNALPCYPSTGAAINSQSANEAISILTDSTAHFIVKSATALRTVP